MTIPTIGFNVETLQYKNIKFQVWDLGRRRSDRTGDATTRTRTRSSLSSMVPIENGGSGEAGAASMLDEEDQGRDLIGTANKQDQKGALGAGMWGSGSAGRAEPPVVHPGDVRDEGQGPVRGLRLARRLHQGRIDTPSNTYLWESASARTFAMCSASSRCGCGSSGRRRSGLSRPFKMS